MPQANAWTSCTEPQTRMILRPWSATGPFVDARRGVITLRSGPGSPRGRRSGRSRARGCAVSTRSIPLLSAFLITSLSTGQGFVRAATRPDPQAVTRASDYAVTRRPASLAVVATRPLLVRLPEVERASIETRRVTPAPVSSPAAADAASFDGFTDRDGRSTRHGDHTLHAQPHTRTQLRPLGSAPAKARQMRLRHDAIALHLALAHAGAVASPATAPPSHIG